MALIKCAECNNEVSEKASSCPKCGAPIAASGPDQGSEEIHDGNQCPFCKKLLEASAITCAFCGAEYGYYNSTNTEVLDDSHLQRLFKQIFIFLAGSAIATVVMIGLSSWFYSRRSIGALFSGMGVVVSFVFILISLKALLNAVVMKSRGKRWWKAR